MKVLVLDEALPHPTDSGKRIRTFELLRRLARAADVTLVVHTTGELEAAGRRACEDAGMRLLPVPRTPLVKKGLRFAWDLARNTVLPSPYMAMAHRTSAMRKAVAAAVAAERPDLIHVEWTPYVVNVPVGLGVPVVVSAHNVESDIWARLRALERLGPRRVYIALQHVKVRRFERRALAAADAVTAVSENDAARIRSWTGQSDVTIVPNGVDPAYFAPRPGAEVDAESALFTGSLDWRPNQDAVLWYVEAVHARVRASRPGARFVVVGRTPPAWLVERLRSAPGVELHASVADVRPYVARAAVSVVPLRIGGGTRLKICEALAMARPVVSTTVGAEGLDVGAGVRVADGAEAFAAAVLEVLADPARALERAREGRAHVLARYTWDGIAALQAEVWLRVAARGAAAGAR